MLGSGGVRLGTVLAVTVALFPFGPSLHAGDGKKKAKLFGLAAGAALGGLFAATEKGASAPRLDEPGAADLALTAGSLGIIAATHFIAPCTGPECCRWCDAKAGQDRLNGLDRWVGSSLRSRDRNRAHRWSDATLYASFGQAIGYLSFGNRTAALRDGALVVESYALNLALTQAAKKIARRPRPYAHRQDPPPGVSLEAEDARLSFFSGHASSSFCVAVATGTIAFARKEKNAGWVLGSGLALAAATGTLRIAADRHYFTDVLVGAAVGSATGFLVPHVHRPTVSTPATGLVAPASRAPRAGFTLPLTVGGGRAGTLTAAYAGGPSLTLRLAW